MKVMLIVDMHDGEYKYFEKYNKHKMVVDIGVDYDHMLGWTFIRRKILCAKLIPSKHGRGSGRKEFIDEILGGDEE